MAAFLQMSLEPIRLDEDRLEGVLTIGERLLSVVILPQDILADSAMERAQLMRELREDWREIARHQRGEAWA